MIGRRLPSSAFSACVAVLVGGIAACAEPSGSVRRDSQPLLDGALDSEDPSVFALMNQGGYVCVATLVAPRVAVTAGHCASATPTFARFGDSVWTATYDVPVVHVRAHPGFDPITLDDDLAVLLLGGDPPDGATPLLVAGPNVLQDGEPVRMVGFGVTAAGGNDTGVKREGTAVARDLAPTRFGLEAAPSSPCDGDSGGPVFAGAGEPVLVGVISGGDPGCKTAFATRLDAFESTFVAPFIAEVARPAALGERCFTDEQCLEGACRSLHDGALPVCTRPCKVDVECHGLLCREGQCAPIGPLPGANGAACGEDHDCAGGLCAGAHGPSDDEDGGPPSGVCRARCVPGVLACDDEAECVPDPGQGRSFCDPPPEEPTAGCAVDAAPPEGGGSAWIGVALLAAAARAARRGRRAGRPPLVAP